LDRKTLGRLSPRVFPGTPPATIWIAQARKIIEKGEKWQEYGRIFTEEVLKRKPPKKLTR
jgi:hypothetical protein